MDKCSYVVIYCPSLSGIAPSISNKYFKSSGWKLHWWAAILQHACMGSCFSCVWFFATLWTVACQAPLSMAFSRQEYWRGLPWPLPGDLPYPGIEPVCPALLVVSCIAGRFFNNWANREYSITWSSSYEQRGFIIWIWGVGNNTVHSSGWDGNKHVVLGQLIKDSCALLRSLGHFHCQQGAGIGIK